MRIPIASALLGVSLSLLAPRPAWATPPRAPRLELELRGTELPRKDPHRVSFPILLHALVPVPADDLRLLRPPGDRVGVTFPFAGLGAGEGRPLSVSVEASRVGTYPILAVAQGAQLDAVVLVRPDRATAVTARDFDAMKQTLLREKLNNRRYSRRNAPLDGIELAITPDKARYQRGEPISFDLVIENSGSEPRTLADGDLGFRELAVLIDGAAVGNQGFGKRLPLADPFPDGILRLAPGARWRGRVTFDDRADLDEIAARPVHTFTYRFMYASLALPFFRASPALANLWQGSLTAGDTPGHTIDVVPGNTVIIPWVPKSMRVDASAADAAPSDAAAFDADAIALPPAGRDAGMSAPIPSDGKHGGCSLSARQADGAPVPAGAGILGLLVVARRRRRRV